LPGNIVSRSNDFIKFELRGSPTNVLPQLEAVAEERTRSSAVLMSTAISAMSRKRLLKEAQRASALNHPNIAGIYDVTRLA
jgi:class 3 adenylate cyclase